MQIPRRRSRELAALTKPSAKSLVRSWKKISQPDDFTASARESQLEFKQTKFTKDNRSTPGTL